MTSLDKKKVEALENGASKGQRGGGYVGRRIEGRDSQDAHQDRIGEDSSTVRERFDISEDEGAFHKLCEILLE